MPEITGDSMLKSETRVLLSIDEKSEEEVENLEHVKRQELMDVDSDFACEKMKASELSNREEDNGTSTDDATGSGIKNNEDDVPGRVNMPSEVLNRQCSAI